MQKMVASTQCSFVPGRQTSDNIVVVQELLHWKLDLEKAYDRISWSFLKSVLEDVGIPGQWVNLYLYFKWVS